MHRISGVVMLAGVIALIFLLDMSLASEESFIELNEYLAMPVSKIALWAVLAALSYHLLAGIRHLIMDMGIGESLEGGRRGAKITLALSLLMIISAGVWLW